MDHIRKHVLILEYFFRSTHTRVWPFPWRVLNGGISGILSYIKQWCTTFILITLYVQVWAASQWRKSACHNCNVSKHSNSFLKCLQMNLMQAERLWSFRAICAPAATLISEQPLQHDYRAPRGYRILPCRLNSRRPQFLPQAFHFPPLQLTAQHILHSYRAGSAVCCKASNTMTRLQQPASGWEKHATEQERGFFCTQRPTYQVPDMPFGTRYRRKSCSHPNVFSESKKPQRRQKQRETELKCQSRSSGEAQKQWDSYRFVLFLLGAAHLIASFEKHNGTDLLAVT